MSCACTYSEQEQLLLDTIAGKSNPYAEKHPRLYRLVAAFEGKKPHIDVERALLFTESMKQTEGELLVLRWAKALKHIGENMTVYIDDDQLIAGRCGQQGARYGILYPELDGDYQASALKELPGHEASPFDVNAEDARAVEEIITPYWKDKTFHQDLNSRLDPESHRLAYADKGGYISRYICCETASNRSSLQWCLDWERLFKLGFKGIREEALARMAELDPDDPVDQSEKRPYLEAIVTVSEGIVTWARRHAELARRKAAEETDPRRKQELLTIASNCEWVPENPPRTFHEAIQAHWFTQAFARLEQKISSNPTNGRMDQLFWPYYQKDLAEGRIDEEGAIELFQCMWASMAQCLDLAITPYNKATHEGYSHWEAVTVGGQTRDGRDATNELSYIIMRSKRECPVLEYDTASKAVFQPGNGKKCFPAKAVFAFLGDEVENYAHTHDGIQIDEFESATRRYPIYECLYNQEKICLCPAPVGSAAAVQVLEYLIAGCVTKIISVGSCGVLEDIPENRFLIPVSALRDEGTSYHYLPPSREVEISKAGINAIESALSQKNIPYWEVKTWTTDGFYRETVEMVQYRKEEGCQVVEMECSALAACAKFRKVTWAMLLFSADTLADPHKYQEREWGKTSISIALELALDAVLSVVEE